MIRKNEIPITLKETICTPKLEMFWDLDAKKKEDLRKRVEVNNGTIRVIVHPFFSEDVRTLEVQKGISRILELPAHRTPPVLIFEEYTSIEKLREKLSATIAQDVYVVPTHLTRGHVRREGDEDVRNVVELSTYDAIVNGSWDKLNAVLKDLGVIEVIVGGMYIDAILQDNEKSLLLRQCIGDVISGLSPSFRIQVSKLTVPAKIHRDILGEPMVIKAFQGLKGGKDKIDIE